MTKIATRTIEMEPMTVRAGFRPPTEQPPMARAGLCGDAANLHGQMTSLRQALWGQMDREMLRHGDSDAAVRAGRQIGILDCFLRGLRNENGPQVASAWRTFVHAELPPRTAARLDFIAPYRPESATPEAVPAPELGATLSLNNVLRTLQPKSQKPGSKSGQFTSTLRPIELPVKPRDTSCGFKTPE